MAILVIILFVLALFSIVAAVTRQPKPDWSFDGVIDYGNIYDWSILNSTLPSCGKSSDVMMMNVHGIPIQVIDPWPYPKIDALFAGRDGKKIIMIGTSSYKIAIGGRALLSYKNGRWVPLIGRDESEEA